MHADVVSLIVSGTYVPKYIIHIAQTDINSSAFLEWREEMD